jgi:hypothetical protein
MAVNPDRLKPFLMQAPAVSTLASRTGGLPTLGSGSSSAYMCGSANFSASGHGGGTRSGKVQQVPAVQRGELRAFQTTFRGGANVLAPPPPPLRASSIAAAGASVTLPERSPDVGAAGGRSLDDVWRKSLFSQAEGITEVDRATIMRPNSEGQVQVLRMLPDRFVMGRVLPPRISVETISAAALNDSGARLMPAKERRAIHDAEVNSRQGFLALREAYKGRRKLANNCAINYPHGVLGCSETPYTVGGLTSDVYAHKAHELVGEELRSMRRGKGGGGARPEMPAATGLDVGATSTPPRAHGRGRRSTPKDTLQLHAD